MKKLQLLILFLLYIGAVNSQIIDNTEGKTFGDIPFFNEAFIKRNKVKSIKGNYASKAKMAYIKKSNDVYFYEFNALGQLIKDYRTQYGDTLINLYEYDSAGLLKTHRKSDNSGFQSYHYTYDNRGRIISKEFRKDINKVGDRLKFKLSKSYSVSIEKYSYEELSGQDYKKIYYNNSGRVYKEEFYYFNEDGYLLKEEGRLKMGSGLTSTTYEYDEMGRVQSKIVEKRVMGNYKSKWEYQYDEHSNVLAQHYYKDGEYKQEIQIVYMPESLLLKAFLYRDEGTDFMTILQFTEYEFYE
ncbi:hypothetical protein [Crocinitomix algicola]|uniref:hypothetical protein n=1 Tax=Crocinitomix algicola TaxID=1740263 RepID=UPI000872DDCF|nr:hypothetical protein [Crocinitomix algicola]